MVEENIPSRHIPDSNVSIASSRHQNMTPRHHGPYTHDMTLQTSQMPPRGVEDVNFCVVESDDDVFVGEMQTCDDSLVRGDLTLIDLAANAPGSLDLVSLLEMGSICHGFRASTYSG